MRTIAIVFLMTLLTVPVCQAQMSMNPDWQERNGLTVASVQKVSVPASLLRGFVTLKTVDDDPRIAIANLSAQKKGAIAALTAINIPADSIKTTTTKILEWDSSPNVLNYYRDDDDALVPTTISEKSTAVAHISFDIPLDGIDSDELVILPFDIQQSLEKTSVFESNNLHFLYVGEVKESQINDAKKKAYDEALENAQSIMRLSGRKLGKLVALTPEVNGRWWYWSEPTYGYWNEIAESKNPISNFRPLENEVFGNDPANLSRHYSIELRFEIE